MWWPICGNFFKDNEHAATLFCRKFVTKSGDTLFNYGKFTLDNKTIPMDSFMIGKCNDNDTSLETCTGGCNLRDIGGRCGNTKCEAFKAENVKIECYDYKNYSAYDLKYAQLNSCKGKLLLQIVVYLIIKKNNEYSSIL